MRAVDVAELYADGAVTADELRSASLPPIEYYESATPENDHRNSADLAVWYAASDDTREAFDERAAGICASHIAFHAGWEYERALEPPVPVLFREDELLRYAAETQWAYETAAVRERERADEERAYQQAVLHCLFGPTPLTPRPLPASFRTAAAVALARAAYDARDFAALPILADALEEAGCADAELLAHCRHGRNHARGCWAVDAVLGNE